MRPVRAVAADPLIAGQLRFACMTIHRDFSDSPPTADPLWQIELDLQQMKRTAQRVRGQLGERSLAMDPLAASDAELQTRLNQLHVYPAASFEFTDRVRKRSRRESRLRQRLLVLFVLAIALVVGAGLVTGLQPLVELGLAAGSIALCWHLIVTVAAPIAPAPPAENAPSAAAQNRPSHAA